jgi:hypothetical protein
MDQQKCGCAQQSGPFSIFTGDAKTMPLRIASSDTGLPIDLTSCTEIVINLPNADGSFTQLKQSLSQVVIVSPALLGQITALITSVNSAKLNIGELQDVDVTFTIGGNPFTVRFYQALSVFELD